MRMSTCTIMHYALCIMGIVNGCGYDGQHKCTICDTCRPCHLILSTLKPVFSPNSTNVLLLQLIKMLRYLDLVIFVSSTTKTTTIMTQPITLPLALAHACEVINQNGEEETLQRQKCWLIDSYSAYLDKID